MPTGATPEVEAPEAAGPDGKGAGGADEPIGELVEAGTTGAVVAGTTEADAGADEPGTTEADANADETGTTATDDAGAVGATVGATVTVTETVTGEQTGQVDDATGTADTDDPIGELLEAGETDADDTDADDPMGDLLEADEAGADDTDADGAVYAGDETGATLLGAGAALVGTTLAEVVAGTGKIVVEMTVE